MSCKEKTLKRGKHYTTMERKVFLQILQEYKHIIEIKKSDSSTLKDKECAWSEICNKYNQSTLICEERTVQQLKKLWTNLKQSQREALTKEKQARMTTGGGPEEAEATIDPDILNLAPDLMKTAPVFFTSNMTETEINDKRDVTFDAISTQNLEIFDIDNECSISIQDENGSIKIQDESFININDKNNKSTNEEINTLQAKKNKKESTTLCDFSEESSSHQVLKRKIDNTKRKSRETTELLDTEEKLKIQRIQ
ncbi:myb/SANT-like DNA-binding domain-containing protein 3 [Linepithema humile]|uniref:myb/SANT-like DNA-binding domain-containing protein 3 n=1 Tax=Linepithema humile TaxID=83485 RepID=UPI00351EA51D